MDGWRANPRYVARGLAAAAALLLAAAAQPTLSQVEQAERARDAGLAAAREAASRQQAALAEERRLAAQRVAAAAALRTSEAATAAAANAMAALARRQADAEARLREHAAALAPMLPPIERMSLYPAETLLAMPAPPEQSLTGLMVLRGVARQLEQEAGALRAEQAEVARLASQMAAQERTLTEAQSQQAAEAAGLDRQIADAKARYAQADDAAAEAARRAAAQASQADSLHAAVAQLDRARKQDEARAAAEAKRHEVVLVRPAEPEPADTHGQMTAPVVGAVVKTFGEPGDAGPANGVSYDAPPAARVTAPCGGRVVFAGPFRSFGQLMIINCGGGYHMVLAGLDRLDVAVGRPVQPGEPVGVMPSWDPRLPGSRPLLYVELRQGGQPINPAPFLRGRS